MTGFENARADIVANGGVDAPDYVVILLGINDLVRLINPKNLDDWFVPGLDATDFPTGSGPHPLPAGNGDYRSAGIFIDGGVDRTASTYDDTSNLIPVSSIKDRYQGLLEDIVHDDAVNTSDAFPDTHIILITVPIPDTTLHGSDDQYEDSRRPLVKETVENYNAEIAELASLGDRFTCVNPQLIRPINTTDTGSPAYVASTDLDDGVPPTVAGYEKIGQAVASEILYLEWANSKFPMGAAETVRGYDAAPDHDGWPNAIEHY